MRADRGPGPRPMTSPRRALTRMILFLVAVATVVAVLAVPIVAAFAANPALNGLILGVLVLGIAYELRQVGRLGPAVAWVERVRHTGDAGAAGTEPGLLAPIAATLHAADDRPLPAGTVRTLLDALGDRLEEARENGRYVVGLLVFLGLLGTFWGLLDTIRSVGDVISGLGVASGDVEAFLGDLQVGLEEPLRGMGTAFSSSLFGLASSLVVGFLDLTAGQAQNRFASEVEDWLVSSARPATLPALVEGAGPAAVPAYVEALLGQTAESLDHLERLLARSEEGQRALQRTLADLADRLGTLVDRSGAEDRLVSRLLASQSETRGILARLAELAERGDLGADEALRGHVRSLDTGLRRLVDEQVEGRERLLEELRRELRLLGRTLLGGAKAP